jgi:hypothetical protein
MDAKKIGMGILAVALSVGAFAATASACEGGHLGRREARIERRAARRGERFERRVERFEHRHGLDRWGR